jgi:hypothetical protein
MASLDDRNEDEFVRHLHILSIIAKGYLNIKEQVDKNINVKDFVTKIRLGDFTID